MNKRLFIALLVCALCGGIHAQNNNYSAYFQHAYSTHPYVPKGLLEAIAFTNTRLHHLYPDTNSNSCTNMPFYYGIMGLVKDGKGYFKNNLKFIAQNSDYTETDIITKPGKCIMAYAQAYGQVLGRHRFFFDPLKLQRSVIEELSELPSNTIGQRYALDSWTCSVFSLLSDKTFMESLGYESYEINLEKLYGPERLAVLSSAKVTLNGNKISGDNGSFYTLRFASPCTDYQNAIWVPADSSNFSSRNNTPVSAVTVHDVEGTYAGCISWFQNPNANVSAHYVLRSSDGQITQMVCEIDKGWHVGTENPYTIGLEHEGYAGQTGWYTPQMYQASADLVKDICNDYAINPLRTYFGPATSGSNVLGGCTKVKGHQHFPNQTHVDPGIYWDWEYYYQLINDNPPVAQLDSVNGTFYDTGGPNGDYGDDERYFVSIEPPNADTLFLLINNFDIELNWDYLFFYDSSKPLTPLIGKYTGTSIPDTITTGGSALIEFRSDCATIAPGWGISWVSDGYKDSTSSIHEITALLQLQAWPNPFNDQLVVEYRLTNSTEIWIELLDMTGRKIVSFPEVKGNIDHNRYMISTSKLNLGKGMYFIKATTNSDHQIIKLIKN